MDEEDQKLMGIFLAVSIESLGLLFEVVLQSNRIQPDVSEREVSGDELSKQRRHQGQRGRSEGRGRRGVLLVQARYEVLLDSRGREETLQHHVHVAVHTLIYETVSHRIKTIEVNDLDFIP